MQTTEDGVVRETPLIASECLSHVSFSFWVAVWAMGQLTVSRCADRAEFEGTEVGLGD